MVHRARNRPRMVLQYATCAATLASLRTRRLNSWCRAGAAQGRVSAPQRRQRPYWCESVVADETTVSASVATGALQHCDARTMKNAQAYGCACSTSELFSIVDSANMHRKIALCRRSMSARLQRLAPAAAPNQGRAAAR